VTLAASDEKTPADYSTGKVDSGGSTGVPSDSARIEALLFVAPGPVEIGRLGAALGLNPNQVENGLDALRDMYQGRGLNLQRHRGRVQLTTSNAFSRDVERFLELESSARLTKAALEVLAVIAYQQPTTRPYVDDIRGVNSESVLRTLLRYGLIEEIGRSDAPGRPILYATTPDFLAYFGLSSLEDLPPLDPDLQLPLPGAVEETNDTSE
jgi:segregation and condensation protein B